MGGVVMRRIILIISLIFSLFFLPDIGRLYANCGTCGVGGGANRSHSRGGGGSNAAAAAAGLLFGVLKAAKAQEESSSGTDREQLIRELTLAFTTMDPTEKYHKKKP